MLQFYMDQTEDMDKMKRCKTMFCVCALAAATVFSVHAEECIVIRPGEVDVVLPAKPLPVERFAAQELTNFLSRVLGAPVPVEDGGGTACAVRPPYQSPRPEPSSAQLCVVFSSKVSVPLTSPKH